MGVHIEQGLFTKTVVAYGSAAALVLVLLILWLHQLRREVTKRKVAEAELQKSRKILESLLTMSSDWFWQQNDQFRFTEFSGAFSNSFTPPGAALGRTRWELTST